MRLIVAALAVGAGISCAPRVGGTQAISGTSQSVVVRGSYSPVAIDRVDRLSLDGGKLVLHGSASTVTVDLPPSADPDKADSHWALVTEGTTEHGRTLTFTHEMSLDDFTIELPAGEAPIRYGGFSGRDGNDVMVLAWGEGSRSYYGTLTIVRKPEAGGSTTPPP